MKKEEININTSPIFTTLYTLQLKARVLFGKRIGV